MGAASTVATLIGSAAPTSARRDNSPPSPRPPRGWRPWANIHKLTAESATPQPIWRSLARRQRSRCSPASSAPWTVRHSWIACPPRLHPGRGLRGPQRFTVPTVYCCAMGGSDQAVCAAAGSSGLRVGLRARPSWWVSRTREQMARGSYWHVVRS
ncbi:hypothetical protein BJY24_005609 [Nocardia transvalensis]|uniref:Uncharacterized protein n=1 Tax=Nocardia transvalensis TaxID=37333 RepID=A0A7W9UKV3_9NOCA|nr:hypothetical protein [Nocardia transvalensis]